METSLENSTPSPLLGIPPCYATAGTLCAPQGWEFWGPPPSLSSGPMVPRLAPGRGHVVAPSPPLMLLAWKTGVTAAVGTKGGPVCKGGSVC